MKSNNRKPALLVLALVVVACLLPAAPQSKFGELTALADKYGTDKGSKDSKDFPAHKFAEVYEYFFQPLKGRATKVLEIGVALGASAKMLRDYFEKAVIYGIDIEDKSSLDSDRIKTFVADQADRKQLEAFISRHGPGYDIIIDDGGHSMEQQQVSFGYLISCVKPGGYYVIEDVHTSFSPRYGAAPDGRNTTFAMITSYLKNGKISSPYMTAAEQNYLTSRLEYGNLFSRDGGRSMTCIFQKKLLKR